MSERAILKSSVAPTIECLTLDQLEALAGGQAESPAHLAQCARCQTELALLKSFESGSPLPDEGAAVAWISSHLERHLDNIKNPTAFKATLASQVLQRQGWLARIFGGGGFRWAVPVMAVAAVAVVSAILLQPSKQPQLEANAGTGTVVYRSQEVTVVGPVGELLQVPKQMQWQSFTGAASYKVEVTEVDQTRLWATETKETDVSIPASICAKMLPGKPILWRVTAIDQSGGVLGASQVQRFTFVPGHTLKN